MAGAYFVGNTFKDAISVIEDYVKLVKAGNIIADVQNQAYRFLGRKIYDHWCSQKLSPAIGDAGAAVSAIKAQ